MAVTITVNAESALTSQLMLNGTIQVEGAKDDGTEKIAITIYNKTTGATFISQAQLYTTASTLSFNYVNGTIMSVNFVSGAWIYQRLSSETNQDAYSYIITFEWTDTDGSQAKTVTIDTLENITFNEVSINPIDDMDDVITGTFDVDILDVKDVTISAVVTTNNRDMAGTEKPLSTTTDIVSWVFLDDTVFTVNLESKTFSYTRKSADINNGSADAYVIQIIVGGKKSTISAISSVGFPPEIKLFTANPAEDTDYQLGGNLSIANVKNSHIRVNATHNGVIYEGEQKEYADILHWDYPDGSVFRYTFSTGVWEYTRLAADTQDLNIDLYVFEVLISNKYGSSIEQVKIETTIPKATILAFSAGNVNDVDRTIKGVLRIELPTLSKNATIRVDTAVNGINYNGSAVSLGGMSASFSYSNGSSFIYDVQDSSFVYNRSSNDFDNGRADTYNFVCYVTVNGETVSQGLTLTSLAGQEVYDYEPAYPVVMAPGSTETQATAWRKYIEENKRLYRLINENFNYYKTASGDTNDSISALKEWVNQKLKEYDSKISSVSNQISQLGIKAISGVAYHGQQLPVPPGSNRSNCRYIVSLNRWTNTRSDNKYTYDMYISVDDNGVLTCYTETSGRDGTGGVYPGYANYLVIDISSFR